MSTGLSLCGYCNQNVSKSSFFFLFFFLQNTAMVTAKNKNIRLKHNQNISKSDGIMLVSQKLRNTAYTSLELLPTFPSYSYINILWTKVYLKYPSYSLIVYYDSLNYLL